MQKINTGKGLSVKSYFQESFLIFLLVFKLKDLLLSLAVPLTAAAQGYQNRPGSEQLFLFETQHCIILLWASLDSMVGKTLLVAGTLPSVSIPAATLKNMKKFFFSDKFCIEN